jgi:hypothetical protein
MALFESEGLAWAGLLDEAGDQPHTVSFNDRDDTPPSRQFQLVRSRDHGHLARRQGVERE